MDRHRPHDRARADHRRGFVQIDHMVGRVDLAQPRHHDRHRRQVIGRALVVPVGQHADLPQHHRGRRVDHPAVQQEIGRLVALAALGRRIDAQIGEQAVLGRDAGQHHRAIARRPRPADGFVAGIGEDPGVAVEGAHHQLAGPDRGKDLRHHLGIGLHPVLAVGIEAGQRRGALGVELPDQALRHRVADDVIDHVGGLDPGHGLDGHLAHGADSGADDHQIQAAPGGVGGLAVAGRGPGGNGGEICTGQGVGHRRSLSRNSHRRGQAGKPGRSPDCIAAPPAA